MSQGAKEVQELKGNHKNDESGSSSREEYSKDHLEEMRSTVLTRWNTRQQDLLAQARRKEQHPLGKSSLPQVRKSNDSPRAATTSA